MQIDNFDFVLPEKNIALRPVYPRDSARMLVVSRENPFFGENIVRDLPELLAKGDTLVVNDTRVIPAQLSGIRINDGTTAKIFATLHKRESADRWRAFMRPAKRVTPGDRVRFGDSAANIADLPTCLDATVVEKSGGEVVLDFDLSGPALDEAILRIGQMPLPPYIAAKRQGDAADRQDYQTLFVSRDGAVAAPTAGLHFTPELIQRLMDKGIDIVHVTLHVGAGTFLPMKGEDTREHTMHAEWGEVSPEAAMRLNAARATGGRIVCVGTTSLRLLETSVQDDGLFRPWRGETAIFITPGYRFKAADALMTNFHLPKSTLFMLVSAFVGMERMKSAYAHAIAQGYRFYSYGDASLLFRADASDGPVPETHGEMGS
jgi:S-adenosylmethionine:tRNA ribosyltransferase-isomerase